MFFKNGTHVELSLVTTTTGGTLTLTASSATYQIFVGNLMHVMVLPNATTLPLGRRFEVVNTSTGTITVQNAGLAILGTVESGATRIFRATDVSTPDGVFDITVASASGGISPEELAQINTLKAGNFSATSRKMQLLPESVGANYYLTKSNFLTARSYPAGLTLNGYGFLVGGFIGSYTSVVDRYDDEANINITRTNVTAGSVWPGSFSIGDYGYVVAGSTSVNSYSNDNYRYDNSLNAWTSRAPTLIGRVGSGSFSIYGKGYICGGTVASNTDTTSTEIYDATSNTWVQCAAVANSRAYITATVHDGKAYASSGYRSAAGSENNVFETYDATRNTWATIGQVYPLSIQGAASGNSGGRLNFFGGQNSGTVYATSYTYSPLSNAFTRITDLPANRRLSGSFTLNGLTSVACGLSSASGSSFVDTNFNYKASVNVNAGFSEQKLLPPLTLSTSVTFNSLISATPVQVRTDGDNWRTPYLKGTETFVTKFGSESSVYLPGGLSSGSRVANVDRYNSTTNTYQSHGSLSAPRADAASAQYNGLGFMFGGFNVGGTPLITIESFNEFTKTPLIKTATLPPLTETGHGASRVGAHIYVYGGRAASYQATNYQYDPIVDSLTTKTSMSTIRYEPSYLSLGGMAHAFGGFDGSTQVASSEAYYPSTDIWLVRGSLNTARYSGGGSTLENRGYIVGGYLSTGPSVSAAVDRFNPETNSCASIASLPASNLEASGGRHNGYIYRLGGADGVGGVNTANYYSSVTGTWTSIANTPTVRRSMRGGFTPNSTFRYEMRVAAPALYLGVGGGTWANKNVATVRRLSASYLGMAFSSYNGSLCAYFNEEANAFVEFAPRIYSVADSTSVDALSHYLISVCPNNGNAATNYTEAYSKDNNVWITLANNSTSRYASAFKTLNKRGIVASGFINPSSVTSNTDSFDITTNTWTSRATSFGAGQNGAAALNGFFYNIGGFQSGGTTAQATAQQYNDAGNSWRVVQSVPQAIIPNNAPCNNFKGRLFIGANTNNIVGLQNFYQYNDNLNIWISKSDVPQIGLGHGGTSQSTLYLGDSSGNQLYGYTDSVKDAVMAASLNVTVS